jgi:hypothetical protein
MASFLTLLCRLLGFVVEFAAWRARRQERQQAQDEADTPLNIKELQDAQRRGDF